MLFTTVLRLSNQRASTTLSLAAMLWAFLSLYYWRRKQGELSPATVAVANDAVCACNMQTIGGVFYNELSDEFTDNAGNAIQFTPMQHKLMLMFFQ